MSNFINQVLEREKQISTLVKKFKLDTDQDSFDELQYDANEEDKRFIDDFRNSRIAYNKVNPYFE